MTSIIQKQKLQFCYKESGQKHKNIKTGKRLSFEGWNYCAVTGGGETTYKEKLSPLIEGGTNICSKIVETSPVSTNEKNKKRRNKPILMYKYEKEQVSKNLYFTSLVGGRYPEKSAPAFESFRKIFLRTDLKSK